jgi:hypothetical protein
VIKDNVDYYFHKLFRIARPDGIVLGECKYHNQIVDSLDLFVVLEMAAKSKHFVNKVGNVYIKNYFDDSHIYDALSYDESNRPAAFCTAIIKTISSRIDLMGDASIKHRCTESLIKDIVTVTTGNDEKITEKIYTE